MRLPALLAPVPDPGDNASIDRLWSAKTKTVVDPLNHFSYIGRVLASRRLRSLHRSSDTHRARPQSGRPLRPSENQHLNYLNYLNSPANPIDSGSASEHHYESTGGNADNAAKSFQQVRSWLEVLEGVERLVECPATF